MTKPAKQFLHILYTTKEGGNLRYTQGRNDKETAKFFDELKSVGFIALKTGDREPTKEKLAYIMLVKALANWDFMINRKRDF